MRLGIVVTVVVLVCGSSYWYFEMLGGGADHMSESEEYRVAEEEVQASLSGGSITEAGDGKKQYVHGERGFSFVFSGNLTVTALPDLEGEILLLRDAASEKEFQIYATYFDEEGPVTAERIKQDLPELVIEEPQAVKIGEGKTIDALIFIGESEDFGRTREVWFVGGGQLFQVITHVENDDFIGPILDTWSFSE